MAVHHSFLWLENLPFFVAETFLSTTCSWHLVTQKPGLNLKYCDASPAYKQLSNSAGFWQQYWVLYHTWSLNLPPTLFISSSLINGSNFIMPLHDFKHFPFPKEMNSFPNVFSGQIWLSTSMPFLLLSNPLVYYNSLRDLFQQMHSVSFLKCKTGPMVLFDLNWTNGSFRSWQTENPSF